MSKKRATAPHSYVQKLEQRLVLLAWLNRLFGHERNRDLVADMKETDEDLLTSDYSSVYHRIAWRGEKVQVAPADLACYDDNIREHLRATNARCKLEGVDLDSYMVSMTPFQDSRKKYGDGTWDKKRFAEAHILFPERDEEYDYLMNMMGRDNCGVRIEFSPRVWA